MIPVHDSARTRRFPWVNYGLIAANFVVFIFMLTLSNKVSSDRFQAQREFVQQTEGVCYGYQVAPTASDAFVCKWAFQPKEFFDAVQGKQAVPNANRALILFSLISAMFLHAGWLHILGNMIFLWVFGDNVEDRFGHAGYLLFYLVAGVAATLTQGAIDPGSLNPVLGASGAIAGVLGAYLVFYPGAWVTGIIPLFVIPIPFRIPAIIMIGLWFAQNLLAGVATINNAYSPDQGVAFFAHVGGFIFGMVIALVLRPQRPPPRRKVWNLHTG